VADVWNLTDPFKRHLAVNPLSVDDTASGKSLAALKGAALAEGLQELILIPDDPEADIRWGVGSAAGDSARLPASGIALPVTKSLADTLRLFCTAGATLTLIELG